MLDKSGEAGNILPVHTLILIFVIFIALPSNFHKGLRPTFILNEFSINKTVFRPSFQILEGFQT